MSEDLCEECRALKPCRMFSCSVANALDKWKALAGELLYALEIAHRRDKEVYRDRNEEKIAETFAKAREAGL